MYTVLINGEKFMDVDKYTLRFDERYNRTDIQFTKNNMAGKMNRALFAPYVKEKTAIKTLEVKNANGETEFSINQTGARLIVFDNLGINILEQMIVGFYYNGK